MRHLLTAAAAAGGVLLAAGSALAADAILIPHVVTSGRDTLTHRAQIERSRIRTELAGAGERRTMVFDRAADWLRVTDDEAKTYSEIQRAEIDGVGGHMAAALRDLQRQAQTATPEERARLDRMIREMTTT